MLVFLSCSQKISTFQKLFQFLKQFLSLFVYYTAFKEKKHIISFHNPQSCFLNTRTKHSSYPISVHSPLLLFFRHNERKSAVWKIVRHILNSKQGRFKKKWFKEFCMGRQAILFGKHVLNSQLFSSLISSSFNHFAAVMILHACKKSMLSASFYFLRF